MKLLQIRPIIHLLCVALFICFTPACVQDKFDETQFGNCTDGKQNQNEEGVDCGGPCMTCSSCGDGIKNASEVGIDCGGSCPSCEPPCSAPVETLEYTVSISSSQIPDDVQVYSGYYSQSSDRMNLSLSSGSIMKSVEIEFMYKFNPYTVLNQGESMMYSTVDFSNSTIAKKSDIRITLRGEYNFSTFSRVLEARQTVYLKKTNAKDLQIRFCNLKAQQDYFSLNTEVTGN